MPDAFPRKQLCLIVEQYGQNIISEPKRCRGLLCDLTPEHRLETNLLMMALEQDVTDQLLKPVGLMPMELQLERLAQSLHEAVGIEENLAYWAVESWALALRVIKQPVPRQISLLKNSVAVSPVLPRSTESVLKQNQRLSIMVFVVVWLTGGILLTGAFVFYSQKRAEVKTPVVMESPKTEEPQVYRVEPEQRNAWSANNLGDTYYYANNYQKAAEWYLNSAQQGDAIAQCNLAFMYFSGFGVGKDYKKALEWYAKAAEQGNADGQNNLGIMYEYGYGVARDEQKAVQWYSKAVEQGHYAAQQTLKKLLEKSPR